MPAVDISRDVARGIVDISADSFVAGLFGTLHASRMPPMLRRAIRAINDRLDEVVVLYVGPDGEEARTLLSGLSVLDAGPLPAKEVSIHLSAMDLHLAPFSDGVSTRRGSFLAGLQQGVPSVSTRGPLSDDRLMEKDGEAFVLTPVETSSAFVDASVSLAEDDARRESIGKAGQTFFEKNFTWSRIAGLLTEWLNDTVPVRR